MKTFKIISLSSASKLIIKDVTHAESPQKAHLIPSSLYHEYPFEAFQINTNIKSRQEMSSLLGKNIQCTLSKTGKSIRYLNPSFFIDKLQTHSVTIIHKQLEESKIYTNEHKIEFFETFQKVKGCQGKDKISSGKSVLLDLSALENKEKFQQFSKYLKKGQSITVSIEYFAKNIHVCYHHHGENSKLYFPVTIDSLLSFYQCLPQATYAPFFEKYSNKIKITINKIIFNTQTHDFQIIVSLPKEAELFMLSNGWAILNHKAIQNYSKQLVEEYLTAEAMSIKEFRGIHKKNKEILGFIYAKDSFTGIVHDILDGFIYEIRKNNQQIVKVQLEKIHCPVDEEFGAFQSREYARKNLISQEVNVYLKKDTGLNIIASVIRVSDSKDIESLIVSHGWGYVREEFQQSILSVKLQELQNIAKEKGKGLFQDKQTGFCRYDDLTGGLSNKQEYFGVRRLEMLKEMTGTKEHGVIYQMIDPITYKIFLESKACFIKFKIQNTISFTSALNPLLPEYAVIIKAFQEIYAQNIQKRDVEIIIHDYYSPNIAFQGSIWILINNQRMNLQQYLMEKSLVFLDKRSQQPEHLLVLEKRIRKEEKHIWQNKLQIFQPDSKLSLSRWKNNFVIGKFSWIEDGETIFLHPECNYQTLKNIWSTLNSKGKEESEKVKKDDLLIGAIVVAPYLGDYYRAQVLSVKSKKVKLLFIDWGNKQTVDQSQLRYLPEALLYINSQCVKTKLFNAKIIKKEEHLESMRSRLFEEGEQKFDILERGEYVINKKSTFKPKYDSNKKAEKQSTTISSTTGATKRYVEKNTGDNKNEKLKEQRKH